MVRLTYNGVCMQKHQHLIKQLVLFGLVGGTSLLLDVTVTTLAYRWWHIPAGIAGVLGFCSAFFFNFPINRKHVFNHTKNDRFGIKAQVGLYVVLSCINIGATAVMMQLAVGSLHSNVSVSKICTTAIIAAWNFLLFKFYIFAKDKPAETYEGLIIQ